MGVSDEQVELLDRAEAWVDPLARGGPEAMKARVGSVAGSWPRTLRRRLWVGQPERVDTQLIQERQGTSETGQISTSPVGDGVGAVGHCVVAGVAVGEAVVINENFGLRISEVDSIRDRIAQL